jgi:DNA-binding Lrp family transcriptional regulator
VSTKAYVLIRTAPGLTQAVYKALQASAAVQSVEIITGPYDLIVALEAEGANRIMAAIINDIRPAAGIRDTLTCFVVPEQETS